MALRHQSKQTIARKQLDKNRGSTADISTSGASRMMLRVDSFMMFVDRRTKSTGGAVSTIHVRPFL